MTRVLFVVGFLFCFCCINNHANAAELSADKTTRSDQLPATPAPPAPADSSSTQAIVRDELRQLFALMQRQSGEADLPDTRVQARPGKTWKRGNYPHFN